MDVLLTSGNYFGSEINARQDKFFYLSITKYDPHEVIEMHSHENAYLSLLINGGYKEITDCKNVNITPGQVIFRPSKSHHSNEFQNSGGRCLNVEWEQAWLEQYELKLALATHPTVYSAGWMGYLNKVLYCLMSNQSLNLSEEYLLLLVSNFNCPSSNLRLPWLAKLKAILENETGVHHSLNTLADRLHLHPVYMARAFKENEGLTIGEFQLKMKLSKALDMLFTGNSSVNHIAYSAGFADAAHFIKAFQMHYEVTPRKFRLALIS